MVTPYVRFITEGLEQVLALEKLRLFTPEELRTHVSGDQAPTWTRNDIVQYTEPKLGYTQDRYHTLLTSRYLVPKSKLYQIVFPSDARFQPLTLKTRATGENSLAELVCLFAELPSYVRLFMVE